VQLLILLFQNKPSLGKDGKDGKGLVMKRFRFDDRPALFSNAAGVFWIVVRLDIVAVLVAKLVVFTGVAGALKEVNIF